MLLPRTCRERMRGLFAVRNSMPVAGAPGVFGVAIRKSALQGLVGVLTLHLRKRFSIE